MNRILHRIPTDSPLGERAWSIDGESNVLRVAKSMFWELGAEITSHYTVILVDGL